MLYKLDKKYKISLFELSLEEKWKIVEEEGNNLSSLLDVLRDAMLYREDNAGISDLIVQTEVIKDKLKNITRLF